MEQKIIELLESIEGAVTGMAPEAWDALVMSAFMTSMTDLLGAFVCVAWIAFYSLRLGPRWSAKFVEGEEPGEFAPPLILLVVGGFLTLFAIAQGTALFSARLWIGLVNPEARTILYLLDQVAK